MTRRLHRSALWIVLLVLCSLGVSPTSAHADVASERIQALERRLEESLKLIEQLSRRIATLEGNPRSTPPPGPSSSASTPAPDREAQAVTALQEEVDQLSEGLSRRRSDEGLPVHGFADVQAARSHGSDPLKLRGFNAGTLDLYLTPQFGDRVRSLAEIAIEYDSDGTGTVDMERLQLGYTVSDALTLWMGRFHTPFGLWNTSFHHGANLQTSIYRPRFIEFEDRGGIIPAHSVGLWGSGKTPLGSGKITYDAYIANGPSIRKRELDFNPFTDDNVGKMVGGNAGYQPSGLLRGLTVGVHALTSDVKAYSPSALPLSRTRLRMAGAYLGYDAHDWEVFAEYYRFVNKDAATSGRRISNAGYLHVGKTFGAFTPFARYERASLDPRDNYFASQLTGRSYTRFAVGSRYEIDARSSFKLEFSQTDEAGATQIDESGMASTAARASYRRAAFQYSIAF
jgi:hypothetical protein